MRDETHCEHGTYIGYPGGADYLCQWCEDGISVREMRAIHKASAHNRMLTEAHILNQIWDALRDCEATEADKRKSWHIVETTYNY